MRSETVTIMPDGTVSSPNEVERIVQRVMEFGGKCGCRDMGKRFCECYGYDSFRELADELRREFVL